MFKVGDLVINLYENCPFCVNWNFPKGKYIISTVNPNHLAATKYQKYLITLKDIDWRSVTKARPAWDVPTFCEHRFILINRSFLAKNPKNMPKDQV